LARLMAGHWEGERSVVRIRDRAADGVEEIQFVADVHNSVSVSSLALTTARHQPQPTCRLLYGRLAASPLVTYVTFAH